MCEKEDTSTTLASRKKGRESGEERGKVGRKGRREWGIVGKKGPERVGGSGEEREGE